MAIFKFKVGDRVLYRNITGRISAITNEYYEVVWYLGEVDVFYVQYGNINFKKCGWTIKL